MKPKESLIASAKACLIHPLTHPKHFDEHPPKIIVEADGVTIRDLEGKSLAHLMAEMDAHGFEIFGYTLEFEGICRACRMRLETETTEKGKATEEWTSKEARPRPT